MTATTDRSRTGTAREDEPIQSDAAWIVWISCGGCEGCTMSVLGATSPRVEELLAGTLTHIPRIALVHAALSFESGHEYRANLERAAAGELSPFVLVVEGSLFDERLAGEGTFSGLGSRNGQPVPVEEWIERLAGAAEAVIALGTCAAWGGIPAARGNATGAMSLNAFLGDGFRSRGGLPVVNFPGCGPSGDAFVEALGYVLLHLGGRVPLDLDDQGRPRWVFREETPVIPARLPYLADDRSTQGEAAASPVPSRGWISGVGGCGSVGGACNGCTRSDFPDGSLPLAVPRH